MRVFLIKAWVALTRGVVILDHVRIWSVFLILGSFYIGWAVAVTIIFS